MPSLLKIMQKTGIINSKSAINTVKHTFYANPKYLCILNL